MARDTDNMHYFRVLRSRRNRKGYNRTTSPVRRLTGQEVRKVGLAFASNVHQDSSIPPLTSIQLSPNGHLLLSKGNRPIKEFERPFAIQKVCLELAPEIEQAFQARPTANLVM